jgi:cell division protein FtsW (lipid II flippase)
MNITNEDIIKKYLDAVTSEMAFNEARAAIQIEVRSHIEDHIKTAKSYGISDDEAIRDSIDRMGDPYEIGRALNNVHKPQFDFILPSLSLTLCLVGLWNLSSAKWISLQLCWIVIGISFLLAIYFLPFSKFKNVLSSLYGLSILGLTISHFSGVSADGHPYLSFLGLNIKIVDLSAVLFSIALPAISFQLRGSRYSKQIAVALFLIPLGYFSLSGFIWAGLLLLISGLCSLGMQKLSDEIFLGTGVLATGLFFSRIKEGLAPMNEINKAILENAHTDYALRSLSVSFGAEILALSLLTGITLYGFRIAFTIKDSILRSIAVVSISLLTVQIVTSVLANVGVLPMISAGVNIPFLSYGGSGIVGNFLTIGVILACIKRRSLSLVET